MNDKTSESIYQKLFGDNNPALDSAKARLADPLIGSYFLTFIIYNWKILFVASASMEVHYKIDKISQYLAPAFPTGWGWITFLLFHPVVFPAIAAGIYLFGFPVIFRKLYKKNLENRVNSKNDQYIADEKLSPIQAKLKELNSKLAMEIEKNNSLNDLKASLEQNNSIVKANYEQMEKKVTELTAANEELSFQLKRSNAILQELANRPNHVAPPSPDESRFFNILEQKGLVQRFVEFTNLIINSNVFVGGDAAGKYERQIPEFTTLGLIKRTSDSKKWEISELGLAVRAYISTQVKA